MVKKHHFPVQLAKEAILTDNLEHAQELLKLPAENGDADAQFLYGYLYGAGYSLMTEAESREWIQKSADQDHPEALYMLACCEYTSTEYHVLSRNYFDLLIGAQSERFQVAMFMLGTLGFIEINQTEDNRIGIRPNLTEPYRFHPPKDAHSWELLKRSASLGSTTAQYNLALYYRDGADGLAQDEEKAREWLIRATRDYEQAGRYKDQEFDIIIAAKATHPNIEFQLAQLYLKYDDEDSIKKGLFYIRNFKNGCDYNDPLYLEIRKFWIDIIEQQRYGVEYNEDDLNQLYKEQHEHYRRGICFRPQWLDYVFRYAQCTYIYNLRGASFEEFVDFAFNHFTKDHTIPDKEKDHDEWFSWAFDAYVLWDSVEILQFYTELFNNPEFLLAQFDIYQLDQGFWAIMGNKDWAITELLENSKLPLDIRIACIDSMVNLFQKLFANHTFEGSAWYMWWDVITYRHDVAYTSPNFIDESDREDARHIQDALFEALLKILYTDSFNCFQASLHGINHLYHPDTKQAIQAYFDAHPDLLGHVRAYMLAASEGKLL